MWGLKLFVYYLVSLSVFADGEYLANESYIFGVKPINCKGPSFSGTPVLYAGQRAKLLVFGNNLTSSLEVGFTSEGDCDYMEPSVLTLDGDHRGVVTFTPPSTNPVFSKVQYHVCLKGQSDHVWRFQGTEEHITVYVYEPLFTNVMYIVLIVVCYMVSSLMTGLNLGLMGLDAHELLLFRNSGTPKEKEYAAKIIPVRRNGNFLVCSLVITATLCNAVSTVATDMFFTDVFTVIITTVLIVLLCEILPQSICSAFPLYTGARTIYMTKLCMILTSPVSYPLGKMLDCLVGKELTETYTKERLRELLKLTRLSSHEQKIITGTLDFSSKTVEEVMTVIDDVFKLPITAVMDFETIAAILASGFSRIPIYVGEKSNIRYVLLTKDLALLDPDAKVPVKILVQNSKSTCHYVSKYTTLESVLGLFKESRHHMVFVVNEEDMSDKAQQGVIGLVTFEDIIEEIFQAEILDETDTLLDNRGKQRVSTSHKPDLISLLLRPTKANAPSENLKLATFHFLSGIEVFSLKHISPKVLISLLNLDIFYSTSGKKQPLDSIYVRGVPADYFVMVLEGQMVVKIGNEELSFEAGPFRYFGVEALRDGAPFIPDFTLLPLNKTLYLKISRTLYQAAMLATKYERTKEFPDINPKSDVYKFFRQIMGPL